ncbi:DUF5908 family protein [Paraburkholderia sp. SOS3]|jgi:hypothetical protein|uniref:DUF5908 family protein n=1 Tax=Paraburkholderia sp. SOS3 TaxID=1926494 RepID=UPI000B13BE4A|nr:DUF5908 family protein [Paraburkholderia sp. SOS3]
MTVEIRELIIQAKVTADEACPVEVLPARRLPDEEWVETIARRVLEMLCEQRLEW